MPSRWEAATRSWRRKVLHYPLPTLMYRNFRLPCTIELQPVSLMPLKMRKVQLGFSLVALIQRVAAPEPPPTTAGASKCRFCDITAEDCPDRIDADPDPSTGDTNDF